MKIIYVGAKYDYGKPERGLSYEYRNFYDSLVKMNGGSNGVFGFFFDEIIKGEGIHRLNEKLAQAVQEKKPDLIFFCGIGPFEKQAIIEMGKKSGVVKVVWMTDDHWQFYKVSKHWARCFDWVVTTDADSLPKYEKIGYNNVILSQWAFNNFSAPGQLNLPKIYEAIFVGGAHGNRKKIIEEAKKFGVNVMCWGTGWPAGRAKDEDLLRIYYQSKINLNFTKSSGVFWKELVLIFLSRNYDRSLRFNSPGMWLDNARSLAPSIWSRQIKGRNFEIPGLGVFFLTEYVRHIEDYYEIGKEIDCFKNPKELADKIKYYLNHDGEREEIARAGRERTLKNHTYEKRFNEIFKKIGLEK